MQSPEGGALDWTRWEQAQVTAAVSLEAHIVGCGIKCALRIALKRTYCTDVSSRVGRMRILVPWWNWQPRWPRQGHRQLSFSACDLTRGVGLGGAVSTRLREIWPGRVFLLRRELGEELFSER